MRLAQGASGARILGVGDYRPVRVMLNTELETMVEKGSIPYTKVGDRIVFSKAALDHLTQ